MGQCDPSTKQTAGSSKCIAHVAQEEEFGRRHAIRMRCNTTLANIDFPIWKEVAQMVVGPAIAEPELEHVPVQFSDEVGR